MSKKFDDDIISTNYDIAIFQFTAGLEQYGSRIPDGWFVFLNFWLIAVFNLTKAENRSKKSKTLLWKRVLHLLKNTDTLQQMLASNAMLGFSSYFTKVGRVLLSAYLGSAELLANENLSLIQVRFWKLYWKAFIKPYEAPQRIVQIKI